jgi:hypothetical protein
MCCSGRCPYENWRGDCTIRCGQPYPKDAACNDPAQLEDDPEYLEWLTHLEDIRLRDLDEEDFFNA